MNDYKNASSDQEEMPPLVARVFIGLGFIVALTLCFAPLWF